METVTVQIGMLWMRVFPQKVFGQKIQQHRLTDTYKVGVLLWNSGYWVGSGIFQYTEWYICKDISVVLVHLMSLWQIEKNSKFYNLNTIKIQLQSKCDTKWCGNVALAGCRGLHIRVLWKWIMWNWWIRLIFHAWIKLNCSLKQGRKTF